MSGIRTEQSAGKRKKGIGKRAVRRAGVLLLVLAMVMTGLPDMGLGLSATVQAAVDTSDGTVLTPGSTFDVSTDVTGNSTLRAEKFYITAGGTYTLTGYNYYDTTARFVIESSCTIVLDSVTLTSGITYEDGTTNNYFSGTHGIFEVAEGVTVDFVLRGTNKVTAKLYSSVTFPVSGILLGAGSTVSFAGDGSLVLGGAIGRRFYSEDAANANLIMKSGLVEVKGIGNSKASGFAGQSLTGVRYQSGKINFRYEGGSFYNVGDDKSLASDNADEYTTRMCSGCRNRVRIQGISADSVQIKKGADGSFSVMKSLWLENGSYRYYQWHNLSVKNAKNTVTDYYVMDGSSYRHFRDTFTGTMTDAVEVTDKASIGGASGTVWAAGTVLPDATLTFKGEVCTGSCTTGSDGSYYRAMPKGTYRVFLKLSGDSNESYIGEITVTEEKEQTFDFSLSRLSGKVTAGGSPVSGARVSAAVKGYTTMVTTASDGSYRLLLPQDMAADGAAFPVMAKRTFYSSTVITENVTWRAASDLTQDFVLTDSGNATDIEVSSEADLVLLSQNANSLSGKHIYLMNDITLSGSFQGIQNTKDIENLQFDGNGYTIKGLTTPLFQCYAGSITLIGVHITDLHLEGAISSSDDTVGGIAYRMEEDSVLDRCSFKGSVTSTYDGAAMVGGLVGYSMRKLTIRNCSAELTKLSGSGGIGGLVGDLGEDSQIVNSRAVIDELVNSGSDGCAGALCGNIGSSETDISIKNCYGVVKKSTGTVYRCYGYYPEWNDSVTCKNNFTYGPDGVFAYYKKDANRAPNLADDLMKAASGTTNALIDKLNTWAASNLGTDYVKWVRGADGYPVHAPSRCTVSYDGGAYGVGSQDSVSVKTTEALTLPDVSFKSADYVQKGWTDTDGGEKKYELKGSLTPEEDITLYPYWELKPLYPYTKPANLTAKYGQTLADIELPDGFAWNSPDDAVGDVGTNTFTATYTPTDTQTYRKDTDAELTVTVSKADAGYTTAVSEVSGLVYNAEEQELVQGGTTADGTIVYSLSEAGSYTETVPKGKDAKDYTVYYKISGDKNHNDSAVDSIKVSVGPLDITGADVTLADTLIWNGKEQSQGVSEVKAGTVTLAEGDYTVSDNKETEPGPYTLTVTGVGNCTGSTTAGFTIAKKEAPAGISAEKSYLYQSGSKGKKESVDIAAMLPADCGATTYTLAANTAGYVTDKAVSADGVLSYKVDTTGNIGDTTTLTVTAVTEHYKDITVKVTLTLSDKYIPTQKKGAEVAIVGSNALTYGEKLGKLRLNTDTAKFVADGTGKEIPGTLAWSAPDDVLDAGTVQAQWKFTPEDTDTYTVLTGTVSIEVAKKVIKVHALDQVIGAGEMVQTVGTQTMPVVSYEGVADGEKEAVLDMTDLPTVTADGYSVSSPEGSYELNVSLAGSVLPAAAKNYTLEKGKTAVLTVFEKKTGESQKVYEEEQSGRLYSLAIAGKGVPNTALADISVENLKKLLTDAEASAVKGSTGNAGKDAVLYLKLSNATVTQQEKTEIENRIKAVVSSDAAAGGYLELSMHLKVEDTSYRQIADISDAALGENKGFRAAVTVDIPDELSVVPSGYTRTYGIVRVDTAEGGLTAEALATTQTGNRLTFEADRYGMYMITMQDTVKSSGSSSSGGVFWPGGIGTPDISVTPEKATLTKAGDSLQLTAEVTSGSTSGITWKSDNEAVAVVDADGKVTAVGSGTAVITAYLQNDKTAEVLITVNIAAAVTPEPSDTPGSTKEPQTSEIPEPSEAVTDFGTLKARSGKQTKTTVTLKWSKVKEADGYLIYGSRCNTKGKKYTQKLLATVRADSRQSWMQTKLAKGTFYRYQIKAYRITEGKRVILAQSKKLYVTTKGGKYTVAGSVKIAKLAGKKVKKKAALTLKTGQSAKIKAYEVPVKKNRPVRHFRALGYESSNSKVAVVTKKGKIKAVGKGTCKIYVYAQNGVYQAVTITVK